MEALYSDVRLSILVVYHFDEFLKGLVTVHLEQLRRNTPPGTTILGAALRLEPDHKAWLSAQPGVLLPELSEMPEGHREEHSAALDQLAKIAFENGASHVATFHQDSFPIEPNWLSRILHDLDDETVFAVVEPRAYNSCMVWGAHWQARGPRMLVNGGISDSSFATDFFSERPYFHRSDGGIGHLMLALSLGLRWRPIRQTAPEVFDGSILHLTGATRIVHIQAGKQRHSRLFKWLRAGARALEEYIPKTWRSKVKRIFGSKEKDWDWKAPIGGGAHATPKEKRAQISQLVADPGGYIEMRRSGTGDGGLNVS